VPVVHHKGDDCKLSPYDAMPNLVTRDIADWIKRYQVDRHPTPPPMR